MASDPNQPRNGWASRFVVLITVLERGRERLSNEIERNRGVTTAMRHIRRNRPNVAPIEPAKILSDSALQQLSIASGANHLHNHYTHRARFVTG